VRHVRSSSANIGGRATLGPVHEDEQLAALAELHDRLAGAGVEYWLFGGWAVDFHAGVVSRADDLELRGVRARVIARAALVAEKSEVRDDPAVAAKDRADVATLGRGGATPPRRGDR